MRVILLSDTHGTLDERILDLCNTASLVVHAGDIGSAAVLESLRARTRVIAVCGNNDTVTKWHRAERRELEMLDERSEIELPGGVLVAIHGHQVRPASERHARLRARYPEARAVVYGHTHRLACDTEAVPWILNPGAAGESRTFGGPSCLVLDAGRTRWRVDPIRYDGRRARRGA